MAKQPNVQPLSDLERAELESAVSQYEFNLLMDEAATRYLENRGITGETASTFRFGVADKSNVLHSKYAGWLAIPYLVGRDSHPATIRFRCMEDHDHRENGHGKYATISGDHGRMFNVPAIHNAENVIHVAEGECFRGDAEILTPNGWVRFDEYDGQDVAQYGMDGSLSFVKPNAVIKKEYSGELVEYSNRQRYYSLTTPGHRIPAFGGKREPHGFVRAEDGAPPALFIPRAGRFDGSGTGYSKDELALMLAISADGSIRKPCGKWRYASTYVVFDLKKERKIERLRGILDGIGIEYSCNEISGGYTSIRLHISGRHEKLGRLLDFSILSSATADEMEFMLDEVAHWGGERAPNRNQVEYSSRYEHNAVWVQTLSHMAGRTSTTIPRSSSIGPWYKVSILHGKDRTGWQSLRGHNRISHDGMVYCVSVDSGAIMVRMNGCISISGNCDAAVLTQCGYDAVALPGANTWKWHHAKMLAGFSHVYVWADPDEAGAEFASTVKRSLRRSASIVALSVGDVGETYLAGGAGALNAAFEAARVD